MIWQVNLVQTPFLQFGYPKISPFVNPTSIYDVQQTSPLPSQRKQAGKAHIGKSFASDFRKCVGTYIRFWSRCATNFWATPELSRSLEHQIENVKISDSNRWIAMCNKYVFHSKSDCGFWYSDSAPASLLDATCNRDVRLTQISFLRFTQIQFHIQLRINYLWKVSSHCLSDLIENEASSPHEMRINKSLSWCFHVEENGANLRGSLKLWDWDGLWDSRSATKRIYCHSILR